MAKKAATAAAQPTPEQLAQEYIDLNLKIKDQKQRLDQITEQLRDHVRETGQKDIGNLMAYERSGTAKIVPTRAGVTADWAVNNLLEELKETAFVSLKLDITAMSKNLGDAAVKKALKKVGADITQTAEIYFKHKV